MADRVDAARGLEVILVDEDGTRHSFNRSSFGRMHCLVFFREPFSKRFDNWLGHKAQARLLMIKPYGNIPPVIPFLAVRPSAFTDILSQRISMSTVGAYHFVAPILLGVGAELLQVSNQRVADVYNHLRGCQRGHTGLNFQVCGLVGNFSVHDTLQANLSVASVY